MRPHKLVHIKGSAFDHGWSSEVTTPPVEPMLITSGPLLCRLCIWSDAEWDALPEAERPVQHACLPGLGWIGAVPITCLN